jgi:ABC-2 type transport system permease protein
MAVMLLLMGMYFTFMYSSNYSNLSFVFISTSSIALLVAPIITMRLISEDKKQKVEQVLFTAPVKLWRIVCGKFFAALTLYMLPFIATLVYELVLMGVTDVNWLLYLSNILGTVLMGAAILSIGLFISSLTESQIIAGVFGLVVSFFIMQIDYFSQTVGQEWFSNICTQISFLSRFNAFTSDQIDFSNIVFFISVTVLFLFFTNTALDKKRWA